MFCQTLRLPACGSMQTCLSWIQSWYSQCRTWGCAELYSWPLEGRVWVSVSPPVRWRGWTGFLLLQRSVSTSLCLLFMFRNVNNFRLSTEFHSLPWSRIQCVLLEYKLLVIGSASPVFENLLLILYCTESLSGHRWRCCTFNKSSLACLWKI